VTLLIIAAGGAFGAVSRYLASGWVQALTGDFFPWGTLAVNVAGCLALGFAVVWLQSSIASAELRGFVTIGFMGSFTTFSTFSYETLEMLRDGEWLRAGGYLAGSLGLGLLAVGLGTIVANSLLKARR